MDAISDTILHPGYKFRCDVADVLRQSGTILSHIERSEALLAQEAHRQSLGITSPDRAQTNEGSQASRRESKRSAAASSSGNPGPTAKMLRTNPHAGRSKQSEGPKGARSGKPSLKLDMPKWIRAFGQGDEGMCINKFCNPQGCNRGGDCKWSHDQAAFNEKWEKFSDITFNPQDFFWTKSN